MRIMCFNFHRLTLCDLQADDSVKDIGRRGESEQSAPPSNRTSPIVGKSKSKSIGKFFFFK